MSHFEKEHSPAAGQTRYSGRSPVAQPIQDDYMSLRPSSIPSPPMSEASISMEPPVAMSTISPELLAQITSHIAAQLRQEIAQGVADQLKHAGQTAHANSKPTGEPVQASAPTYQVKAVEEPQTVSPDALGITSSPTPSSHGSRTPPSPTAVAAWTNDDSNASPPRSPQSAAGSPTKEKTGVRFTNPRGRMDKERKERPQAYRSFSNTEMELSAVDQRWGRLFDSSQRPTQRLAQVLRGLANYLIAEFEPKKSIVITPSKLVKFYEDHVLESESFPFKEIFSSNAHDLLSEMYKDLNCQHHLIQEEDFGAPTIPGLTPNGFAHWITTWILAYPDQEVARLEKVMCKLPIDADGAAGDGKPERLPKQISRYLFPTEKDESMRREVEEAMKDFLDESGLCRLRQASNATEPRARRESAAQPPPPTKARPIDIPQSKGAHREIERPPYQGFSVDTPTFQDNRPIERDRQPYVAQPGSGRVFPDSLSPPDPASRDRAQSSSRITGRPEVDQRRPRSGSSASSRPYVGPSRGGGSSARRQSPPVQSHRHSVPLNIDTSHSYATDSSAPRSAQHYTPGIYTPSSSNPSYPAQERDRRYTIDPRRHNRRSMTADELPPSYSSITAQRGAHDDHEHSRRESRASPRTSPVLHQDFNPGTRKASTSPTEEYYRSVAGPLSPRGEGVAKYFGRS